MKCGCGKSLSIPPTFKSSKAKCPGCGAILSMGAAPASGPTIGIYKVQATIEKSPRGVVYRALDGKGAAVRLVGPPPAVTKSPEFVKRFRVEAQQAKALAHENLLRILGLVEDRGTPYVVTEDVDGETLAVLFAREGAMDVQRAGSIVCQILEALAVAHTAKIVHRDLRPEHVWIDASGRVRVSGLGLAKPNNRELRDAPPDAVDLPVYLSPEQIKGEPVTGRADLYSLGCMFYHALTGRPPYDETNPARLKMLHGGTQEPLAVRQRRNDIAVPLSRLVMRLMAKDAQQRYMKAEVALRDLRNALGIQEPAPAVVEVSVDAEGEEEIVEEEGEAEAEPRRRVPTWAWAGIAVFLVGAAVAAIFVMKSLKITPTPPPPQANAPTTTGGAPPTPPPDVVNVKPTETNPNGITVEPAEDPMEARRRATRREVDRFFAEGEQFADSTGYEIAIKDYHAMAETITKSTLEKDFAADLARATRSESICTGLSAAAKRLAEGKPEDARAELDKLRPLIAPLTEEAMKHNWTRRVDRIYNEIDEAPLKAAHDTLNSVWQSGKGLPAEEMDRAFAMIESHPNSTWSQMAMANGRMLSDALRDQILKSCEELEVVNAEKSFAKFKINFGRAPWAKDEVPKLREAIDKAKAELPPDQQPP